MAGYDHDGYDGGDYGNYDWCEDSDEDEALVIRGYDTAEFVVPPGHPEGVFQHCAVLAFADHEKERQRQLNIADLKNDLLAYEIELRLEVILPLYDEKFDLARELMALPEGHPRIAEINKRSAEIDDIDNYERDKHTARRAEVQAYMYEYDRKIEDPAYDPYKDEEFQARLAIARPYLQRRSREKKLVKRTEKAKKIISKMQEEYGHAVTRDAILPLLGKI